jgi:hypothetical protein
MTVAPISFVRGRRGAELMREGQALPEPEGVRGVASDSISSEISE